MDKKTNELIERMSKRKAKNAMTTMAFEELLMNKDKEKAFKLFDAAKTIK